MSDRPDNLSAEEAISKLKEGNERFVSDSPTHPHGDSSRRQELVSGQRPFATVVTCADSRLSPELIFDQGLGDVFVIRVAGNIADAPVLGSIEYAAKFLGCNLIVVMGHQACGAVGAAVDNHDAKGPATGTHIDSLIDAIRPAVKAALESGENDLLERSVRKNASVVADQVRSAEPIMSELSAGPVKVVPAYYHLDGGKVEWL
ncbi:MAG: carbonic anhydrase [Deltaproteobacteria bacterium]|nr:carbonic anhydrase [Deltaproteobacteria bacterium]